MELKRILLLLGVLLTAFSVKAQEKYFECTPSGMKLSEAKAVINMGGTNAARLEKKLFDYIAARKYEYKSWLSSPGKIVYRSFIKFCSKEECLADIYAVVWIHVYIDSGQIQVKHTENLYSGVWGAELEINKSDDVVSRNDVPFGEFAFSNSESFRVGYLESPYYFDRKGTFYISNAKTKEKLEAGFDNLLADMISFLKN